MAPPRVEDLVRAFALVNVTKAAWELRLPHILADAGCDGLSLAEIARRLLQTSSSRHHNNPVRCEQALRRILSSLAAQHLVRCRVDDNNNETYSLPAASSAAGGDGEEVNHHIWPAIGPFAALLLHPNVLSMWDELPDTVVNGNESRPNFYTLLDRDTAFRHKFDAAMISLSYAFIRSFCSWKSYDMDPDRQARTLVDLGGGSGHFAAAIARHYPHLTRVINSDLPHVIAAAPNHSGVEHMQGDTFQFVPCADIIIIKTVLHNWSDEDCIRVLQNCHKSLIGCGKLVIIDVAQENKIGDETHISGAHAKLAMDIVMLTMFTTSKGKKRTKSEWGIILTQAKFENYKFFELQDSRSLLSIIEATH